VSLPALAGELPGARVLFTSRAGGVSEGPYESLNLGLLTEDDPAAVAENQRRVAAAVGIPFARFQRGRQVHGNGVRALREPPDPQSEVQDADVQATSAPGVAVVVLTADCLPIAIAGQGAVAVVHAGWRGLAGGVVEAGARAVRELGARGELAAIVGPGIGPCCYEVGEEVHARFGTSGRTLDLKAIARERLRAAGVASVEDVEVCTSCSAAHFSHRRDSGTTGRQAGVAWRT
jgi:YfiH family protein